MWFCNLITIFNSIISSFLSYKSSYRKQWEGITYMCSLCVRIFIGRYSWNIYAEESICDALDSLLLIHVLLLSLCQHLTQGHFMLALKHEIPKYVVYQTLYFRLYIRGDTWSNRPLTWKACQSDELGGNEAHSTTTFLSLPWGRSQTTLTRRGR